MDAINPSWPLLETKADDDENTDDTDVEKALAEFTDTATKRLAEVEEKADAATKRADDLELQIKRRGSAEGDDKEEKAETKAFTHFLRSGRETMEADEVKALRASDDTTGGYLAPSDFQTEIIKQIVELSPVRQAARVGSTSRGEVILPKRTGKPTGRWVGENEESTETGSTYGQIEIAIHEQAAHVDVSQRLLEDAAVNIDAEVSADLAEEFSVMEASAFVKGDGAKKPFGFMNAKGIGEKVSGHASQVTAEGLISMAYGLKTAYRRNAVWMMNSSSLEAIRKLKDGQGNFLWQPSYQAGEPETLLGRPVVEAPDMDDIAAGKFPIAFGDWNRGFRIYDRVGLSILRDGYTQATKGLVRFHARRRVGGAVVLPEAIIKHKISAS